VGLAEDLLHEERQPVVVVLAPVVRVAFVPSVVAVAPLPEGGVLTEGPLGRNDAHQHEPRDALGVAPGHPQPVCAAHRQPDDSGPADVKVIEQVDAVVDDAVEFERRWLGGSLSPADTGGIEGGHAERACQVRDL
jgi:hypothetical protein